MTLSTYDNKIICIKDTSGHVFAGLASFLVGECNCEEEGLRIGEYVLFASEIESIEELATFALIRATETWQKAGAYYVRIQAMAKKHHITLRQEFDEHDGQDTKYIVLTDDDFPIATARMYQLDKISIMIGRVVVLPEYCHRGIGTMVVQECEKWAGELGFRKAVLESRENKVKFYQSMGYEMTGEAVEGDTFRCFRMEKKI